jgi:hypothetical protein
MIMAVVTGVRDTNNILTANQNNRLKIDMSEKIALLQPSATPFITFLKRAKGNTEAAKNPKFSWFEDDLGARWDALNMAGNAAADATKIIFDTGGIFSVGDIVKVPRTGECFTITAVDPDGDNANEFTVVRGYGSTAAAIINNDDPLVIIGNANQEGAGVRTIKSTQEVEVYNYTQIWRTPFGVTNTQNASDFYGGSDLSYQQKKKGIEHARDIARSFLFGELKLDTTGTHPKRTTKGLLGFLSENNYAAGGALTQAEFDTNVAEVCFKYGSKEKLMLCSARVLSTINTWALGKLQIQQDETTFGLAVVKYVSPFGILNLVHEPMFEGAIYGGYAAILDVENIKYRPLKGRDTKLNTNIQANDTDGRTDEYITEAGLEVRSAKTHAIVTGVTGAT